MTFRPTAEQELILTAARETTENLLLVARAGSAKTTTLTMIAEAIAPTKCLCLAFNKKIAVELQTRLPKTATAQTLHSLGMAAWQGFIGKWPKVADRKVYDLLRAEIDHLTGEEMSEAFDQMAETLKMIRDAKAFGYLPAKINSLAKPLFDRAGFAASLDEEPSELQLLLLDRVLASSFKQALEGQIDFDDMVYLPAIMSVTFPTFPVVMTDESQDLSALNHVILKKLVKKNRLIAVGDPCQAIYAFRGASETSMTDLKDAFAMRELFLTVCFRSSEAVVRNARWRAPDMQWGPNPPKGGVHHLTTWGPSDLQPGDAIICRNNAPLFRMALNLLKEGLHPELYSGDIMTSLMKIMKKLGKPATPSAEAIAALDQWHDEKLKTSRSPGSITDQRECILIFLEQSSTLEAAQQLLQQIANAAGSIKLMTGHKSKGLEFPRVFFLDKSLLKKEGQDRNVRYVIETRAKNDLYYVKKDDWMKPALMETAYEA